MSQKLTQIARSSKEGVKLLGVLSGVLFVCGVVCLFAKEKRA